MQSYRLYFLSAANGHILNFEVIEAAADAEAVDLASRKVGLQPMELWKEGRKLRRFAATVRPAPEIRLHTAR
ncbi:MAG: hypothetical protein JWL91_2420 [Sphingomonas bacterium]|nr:hypothetical protein [Sphingomonas bacterium]MDB5690544.1 hypothetical protein [Sphingomonas bacterium]